MHSTIKFRTTQVAVFVICVGASRAAVADIITSTVAGGPWQLGETWVGGVVPTAVDDVIVAGAVTLETDPSCASLDVAGGGSLDLPGSTLHALSVSGDIGNSGDISQTGTAHLRILAGGNVTNSGTWSNWELQFTGIGDRELRSTGSFTTNLTDEADVFGRIVVPADLELDGSTQLENLVIDLSDGARLTLRNSYVNSSINANGNEIEFENSNIISGTIDAAVLVGDVALASEARFIGGVTIEGDVQNFSSLGASTVFVSGTMVNNGSVKGDVGFELSGDLVCNGTLENRTINFRGAGPFQLTMGELGVIECSVYLQSGAGRLLEIETDSRFHSTLSTLSGSIVLRAGTTMTLGPAEAGGNGFVSAATLLANGATIHQEGPRGGISFGVADRVVLDGVVQVYDDTHFTGGLTVLGTMRNPLLQASTVRVSGTLVNGGTIRDDTRAFAVHADGDVINGGIMEQALLELDGVVDQTVRIGGGISATVRLVSDLTGFEYQWFRDGEPLFNATDRIYELIGVSEAEAGVYICEVNEEFVSRKIIIEDGIVGTETAIAPAASLLRAISPNPILRSATVSFTQPTSGPVAARVFDVSGRVRAVVLDTVLDAGEHLVHWQRGRLAPGVYFLTLETNGAREVRKLTIMD